MKYPISLRLLSLLIISFGAQAQDSVLILLRPPDGDSKPCSMTTEPRLITVREVKIAGKGEIRMAGELGDVSSVSTVPRDRFSKLRKVKIRDSGEIEVRNGLLYVGGEGQKVLALPDLEPGRGQSMSLAQYAGMSLEGESREKKSKQKEVYSLRSVWRMFILGSVTQEEALFRHAQEENNVAQWTFYIAKARDYRVKEASERLAQTTVGCIDAAMERFRKGDYKAIEEAKQLASRVIAISGGSSPAAERLTAIKKEEDLVREKIRAGTQQRREKKWDDAIKTWEPVTKYLKDASQKDFAEAYDDALQSSHDLHVEAAKQAAAGDSGRGVEFVADNVAPLTKALREYEFALSRRPSSEVAVQGRREMLIRLALIDVKQLRAANNAAKARDRLLGVSKDQGEDARVTKELQEVNCIYGAQLFEEAAKLVVPAGANPVQKSTPPRSAKSAASPGRTPAASARTAKVRQIQSPADKKPFVSAREKLAFAVSICPADDKLRLLAAVNSALADYHVDQAKKASRRKLYATALLHLNAAQFFNSERTDLEGLLAAAKEPVQHESQIQAGVVITSSNADCADAARQLTNAVESALVEGGSTNIQLIGHEEADRILRRIKSGSIAPGGMNYAIVSGKISACNIHVSKQTRSVASYIQTHNDTYDQLQNSIRDFDRQVDECKRQYPANERVACSGLRGQRSRVQDQLRTQQPENQRPYNYTEFPVNVTGQLKLSLQIDDSILHGTRPAGEAAGSINETCVARSGVQDNDHSRSGLGLTPVENASCPEPDRASKLLEMADQVKAQVRVEAATAFRSVARSYLELAKRATDQDLALENYIAFTLLSSDRTGPDYQTALTAIRNRDVDLKPETALR